MMAVRSNHRKNSNAGLLFILPVITFDSSIPFPINTNDYAFFPSDEEEEDIERIDLGKLKHIEEEERREQNG